MNIDTVDETRDNLLPVIFIPSLILQHDEQSYSNKTLLEKDNIQFVTSYPLNEIKYSYQYDGKDFQVCYKIRYRDNNGKQEIDDYEIELEYDGTLYDIKGKGGNPNLFHNKFYVLLHNSKSHADLRIWEATNTIFLMVSRSTLQVSQVGIGLELAYPITGNPSLTATLANLNWSRVQVKQQEPLHASGIWLIKKGYHMTLYTIDNNAKSFTFLADSIQMNMNYQILMDHNKQPVHLPYKDPI